MKIFVMSGYSAEWQRARNFAALFHRVIAKPFTLDQIGKAVEEELRASPGTDRRKATVVRKQSLRRA